VQTSIDFKASGNKNRKPYPSGIYWYCEKATVETASQIDKRGELTRLFYY
jgi:hypothetical protein